MLLGCEVHCCLAIRLLTNLADFHPGNISLSTRDIREWSLGAFTSMGAVRLFLQARAVIKFFLLAASTLENTNGEQ